MVARAEAAAATRERLLASAWRQFADRHFEDVRLADVAADAGVSAQTLHAHFGTKDELFVAAWAWRMAPEGARRDSAPRRRRRARRCACSTTPTTSDGDAVLRLLAQEERIPAVREMADAGRRVAPRLGAAHVRAAARRSDAARRGSGGWSRSSWPPTCSSGSCFAVRWDSAAGRPSGS